MIATDKMIAYCSRVFLLLCVFVLSRASAQNKGDVLLGNWMDSKRQLMVRCYKENGKYFAKTLWVENLKDKGKPLPKDKQHWINMVVMKDFEYRNNEWANGTIYQPKTDKTYTSYITLINENTIKVTGYIWLRVFSESEIFMRVKK